MLLISASERVLMYETAASIQEDKYGQTLEGFRNSEHFEIGANKAAIPWKITNGKWISTKTLIKFQHTIWSLNFHNQILFAKFIVN